MFDLTVLGSSSKGNCYIIKSEKETLLIECGIKYKDILKGLNFKLSNIVGCLVSHEHKDHSKYAKDIIKNGVDVYATAGTINAIDIHGHRVHVIESEKQFQIGGFHFLPFSTEHDAKEPVGFLIYHSEIGKILFATDTYYIKYCFTGLDYLMIECNFSKEIMAKNIESGRLHPSMRNRLLTSHFSFDNVKKFLKETDLSQTKKIILIHLSDGNSNAQQFKDEIERQTGIPVMIA